MIVGDHRSIAAIVTRLPPSAVPTSVVLARAQHARPRNHCRICERDGIGRRASSTLGRCRSSRWWARRYATPVRAAPRHRRARICQGSLRVQVHLERGLVGHCPEHADRQAMNIAFTTVVDAYDDERRAPAHRGDLRVRIGRLLPNEVVVVRRTEDGLAAAGVSDARVDSPRRTRDRARGAPIEPLVVRIVKGRLPRSPSSPRVTIGSVRADNRTDGEMCARERDRRCPGLMIQPTVPASAVGISRSLYSVGWRGNESARDETTSLPLRDGGHGVPEFDDTPLLRASLPMTHE